MKRTGLLLLSLIVALFVAEAALRLLGFTPAHIGENNTGIRVEPDSFCVIDNTLGWRLGNGCYTTYLHNTAILYHCTDSLGNRQVLEYTHTIDTPVTKLYLYGCSYTFGQSVSDTNNLAYYIQQASTHIQVVNKGVPGFGLTQMFLSLKQDVEHGRKPQVAVFNYAAFQDGRTPLNKAWARSFKYATELSYGKEFVDFKYPYSTLNNSNTIEIKYMPWNEMPTDFPLRAYSALSNLVNTNIDNYNEKSNAEGYKKTSMRLALAIADYCNKNNIKLVFGGFDSGSKQILEVMSKQANVKTLYYDVDISLPGNNCAPFDPFHPSPKVQLIYAGKLLALLNANKWLTP